jgi:hypothetical protein
MLRSRSFSSSAPDPAGDHAIDQKAARIGLSDTFERISG